MTDNKHRPEWEIHLGFYPGILLGVRTYYLETHNDHVLYLPFIDICITIYKN